MNAGCLHTHTHAGTRIANELAAVQNTKVERVVATHENEEKDGEQQEKDGMVERVSQEGACGRRTWRTRRRSRSRTKPF